MKFTRLFPDNVRKETVITRPTYMEERAAELEVAGYFFEIEKSSVITDSIVLRAYNTDSLSRKVLLRTVTCANGPDVPIAVDSLVNFAYDYHKRVFSKEPRR